VYKNDMRMHLAAGPQLDVAKFTSAAFVTRADYRSAARNSHEARAAQIGGKHGFPISGVWMIAAPSHIGVKQIALGAVDKQPPARILVRAARTQVRARFESAFEKRQRSNPKIPREARTRWRDGSNAALDTNAKRKVHEAARIIGFVRLDDTWRSARLAERERSTLTHGESAAEPPVHDVCFVHPKRARTRTLSSGRPPRGAGKLPRCSDSCIRCVAPPSRADRALGGARETQPPRKGRGSFVFATSTHEPARHNQSCSAHGTVSCLLSWRQGDETQ